MKKFSKLLLAKELFKHRGVIRRLPDAYRMVKMWAKGQYPAGSMDILLPLLGILYILSPIDIIPDIAIPFIGVADDLAVLSLVLPKLSKEIDKFLLWELQNK